MNVTWTFLSFSPDLILTANSYLVILASDKDLLNKRPGLCNSVPKSYKPARPGWEHARTNIDNCWRAFLLPHLK